MRALTTTPFDDDKLREECGVFGVFRHPDAAALTVLGLHALQHRGQEGAGIVTYDGSQFHSARHLGLVGDSFTQPAVVDGLTGDRAIGHVRYSTHGGPMERNIQPLFAEFSGGGFAVAHNGNLTNAVTLQDRLQKRGSIFQSTSDTEVILHLIATSSRGRLVEKIVDALRQVEGAYSLVCLSAKKMIGCRDPLGSGRSSGRPRRRANPGLRDLCADIIGATFVRDVRAGEMVIITPRNRSQFPRPAKSLLCVFGTVYFARPITVEAVHAILRGSGSAPSSRGNPPSPTSSFRLTGTPAAIDYAEAPACRSTWHHPQPLCRADLHRAERCHPPWASASHNINRGVLAGARRPVDDPSSAAPPRSRSCDDPPEAGAAGCTCGSRARRRSTPAYGVDTPEDRN
jgi:amidophosphoribosyltransferase